MKKTQILFLLLLIAESIFAQTPFIRNFLPEEYKVSGQNWDIVQSKQGIMYFANNYGVIEYDGTNWRCTPTPTLARSLCIDSLGTIYVGLEADLGFLKPDSIGSLKYISLKNKISKKYQDIKQVWSTYNLRSKIVFVSSNKLYILQNNRIKVLNSDINFINDFVVNNKLYIEKQNGNLYLYDKDSLRILTKKIKLNNISISAMLPFKDGDILLTTYYKGIYIFNPNKSPYLWKPEKFIDVDEFLIKNVAINGTILHNGNFAISTEKKGIIVFDKTGKIQKCYNKQNGLLSNCPYYLYTDLNNQLWVVYENGISLIMNNLPFINYTDKNGLDGSIYCTKKFHNKLYVGTSNNLYVQKKDGNFKAIEGTEGQNYYLFEAHGKLLLGNNPNGIFEIKDSKVIQIESLKKLHPSIAIIKLLKHPNYLITLISDKGLALLEYKNKQWVFKHFINGFKDISRYIVEDNNENFWLSSKNGLCKFRLNNSLDSITFLQNFTADKFNLPKNSLIMPYKLNDGQIIFGTDKCVYRYIPEKNNFELHPDFSMITESVFHLKQVKNSNTIWFEEYINDGTGEKGEMHLVNGEYKIYKTPFLKFTDRCCTNSYSLNPSSDSVIYFGTNLSLLEYHPKQKVNYNTPFNTLIRKIFVNDSLFYAGYSKDTLSIYSNHVILKYKNNDIFFHYAATFFEESEKNLFSFHLVGSPDTTWSDWTTDNKKEYTNLHEGKYTFEVRSKNIYQKYGKKATFSFEILPPWERTWWAFTLYGLIAIIIVYILIRINSKRLKRQNELLKKTVDERTADISKQKEKLQIQSEELKEKNKRLKLLNSTKDKFFAIISHDLRSPFNGILGFANLLVENYDNFDDSHRKEIILLLRESSQSAFELLENLLSWSRIQRGQIEINKEKLNLKELVENSIAPYKYNASKKNIDIITDIPIDAQIFIDKNTIMITIANLVNNAIKFTPEGGHIKINYNKNKVNIELHIIDNGIGMTAEVIEKLFRIDENISTRGTNNEKGTGLGLILCKEFIQKNGGNLSVISEVEKGSDFIITIPN